MKKVEIVKWDGLDAVFFSAGGYEALIVPEMGANVIRLFDRLRGIDIIRTPPNTGIFKRQPEVYGIPILFPPGRISGGTFKAGERVYRFPVNTTYNNHMHGFLKEQAFDLARAEMVNEEAVEVECSFSCSKSTVFFRCFPHEFEFKLLCRLSNKGLEQFFSVVNTSSCPMPMGLGFHTAFKVPFCNEGMENQCSIKVSIGESWELDERMLPTGKKLPLDKRDAKFRTEGVTPKGERVFGHFTARNVRMNGKEFNGAFIEDVVSGIRVIYEVGSLFGHWMVWNDTGDKGFFCIEPLSWVANAPNLDLPCSETGFVMLEAGEEWEESTRIYIEVF